jgi:hypothetical protein
MSSRALSQPRSRSARNPRERRPQPVTDEPLPREPKVGADSACAKRVKQQSSKDGSFAMDSDSSEPFTHPGVAGRLARMMVSDPHTRRRRSGRSGE